MPFRIAWQVKLDFLEFDSISKGKHLYWQMRMTWWKFLPVQYDKFDHKPLVDKISKEVGCSCDREANLYFT